VDKVATAGAIAPLNLVFIPREFQPAGETFDSRFHFAGPAIEARTATSPWTSPGSPLLFISLAHLAYRLPQFRRLTPKVVG
jgi:hypothetical protein